MDHQGLETMSRLMDSLRDNPPDAFAGRNVISLKDCRSGTTLLLNGRSSQKNIELPSSKVLPFFLAGGSSVTSRPSGTGPKIEFHVSWRSAAGTALDVAIREVQCAIGLIGAQIKKPIDEA
jgi:phosphoglucomutase